MHTTDEREAVSLAIDRTTVELEAAGTATSSSWQQVLDGLLVIIDYDERIERLEAAVQQLVAWRIEQDGDDGR